ncbi:hypothetical protein LTR42_001950 [Elasticomyces elasticus]|nr:hypothetical protein LTR42_001950 [Elasticomyces elasticus]
MAHKKSKTSTKQQIPQASNSTAHILRLPVELIEYIGHTARRKDLLALRQTCRDIRDGIQRPFARVYFVEKTFMLPDPESMSALKDEENHLRQLQARIDEPDSFALQYSEPRKPEGPGREEFRAKMRERRRRCTELPIEQRKYDREYKWSPVLTEALRNFKISPGKMHITLPKTRSNYGVEACGLESIYRLYGIDHCMASVKRGDEEHLMGTEFLRAIIKGSCPIAGLEITALRLGIDIPVRTLEDLSAFGAAPTVFAGLRILDIRVNRHLWLEDGEATSKRLLDFLGGAQSIENLTLRCPDRGQPVFDHFIAIATLPRLQHLSLYASFPKLANILAFTKRHEQTLKRVIGYRLHPGVWDDILVPVRHEMKRVHPGIEFFFSRD